MGIRGRRRSRARQGRWRWRRARQRYARLRERIGERFRVRLGNWRDESVGPHEQAMYQVSFATEIFAALVPGA
ncbi:hypothetical protein MPL3356_380005 [Mesorhizobium plurifarium]|uniref:Uncharacterized protein n=1 Tax=Mesorhizobium plurifarium TaxID=69974 RepID=A0A090DWS8_MESPL|nr:hypothetical protein MPL3356_380005 [Mesorhizobium plurifarium]